MTTATAEQSRLASYAFESSPVCEPQVAMTEGEDSPDNFTYRVRNLDTRVARSFDDVRRVKRRLMGFLVQLEGRAARVAFVEGGETVLYFLPAEDLRKAGITEESQPFEMDEVEIKTESGLIVGYEYRPLARRHDAFRDSFELDAERARKRDLIFKTFGNAQT